jgi:hypothetical protein
MDDSAAHETAMSSNSKHLVNLFCAAWRFVVPPKGGHSVPARISVVSLLALASLIALSAAAVPALAQQTYGEASRYEERNGQHFQVLVRRGPDHAIMTFRGAALRDARQTRAVSELVLRFDRPISRQSVRYAAEAIPDWVESASVDGDTVVIRALRPVDYQMREEPNGVIIRMVPRDERPVPEAGRQADGMARLDPPRDDQSDGWYDGEPAAAPRAHAPPQGGSVRLGAMADAGIGAFAAARRIHDWVFARRLGDDGLTHDRPEFRRQAGARLRGRYDRAHIQGGERQQAAQIIGAVHPFAGLTVALFGDARQVKEDTLPVDEWKYRGELALGYEIAPGVVLRGSVFGAREVGGAVAFLRRTPVSETTARVAYRQPYWELPAAFAANAVRDAVELSHERVLFTDFVAGLAGHYARYGVPGVDDDAARGAGFLASLRYFFDLGPVLTSLGGSIEAEYIHNRSVPVTDLPLVNRELYAGDIAFAAELLPGLRGEIFGGYGWDRYSDHGAFGGLALNFQPFSSVDIGIAGSYSQLSGRGDGRSVWRAGGQATVYFPFGN